MWHHSVKERTERITQYTKNLRTTTLLTYSTSCLLSKLFTVNFSMKTKESDDNIKIIKDSGGLSYCKD